MADVGQQGLMCALIGGRFGKEGTHRVRSDLASFAAIAVHPSAIPRAPDDETRRGERARFVEDLKRIAAVIGRRR